jgi:GNAT superfamily N-acetyltransferase
MRLFLESTWRPELQRAEIQDEGMDTLLACDAAGLLAGFAQIRVARPPAGIEAHAPVELKRFYVDKPWHGTGLARTLMEAAEHTARARGGREFWLGVFQRNERALAFYRKCGFRNVGTQVFVVGTDPQKDYVMLKAL